MNLPRALRPVVTLLLLVALTPACGEDPPADASSDGTSGRPDTTGTAGTTGTIDAPPTTGPNSDGESTGTTGTGTTGADTTGTGTTGTGTTGADATGTGTTGPDATGTGTTGPDATGTSDSSSSSRGDDSTGSGTSGGEADMLGTSQEGCFASGEVSPSLPHEAGHLAATVLTPDSYPFEVSRVQYTLRRNLVADCVNTYAHRLEIFVIEGGELPAMPSTDASTFVSIAVEESLEDVKLRVLEPELDPPVVLTDGQSLVVAVSLEADLEANLALCLDVCVGGGVAGVNFWSAAPAEPYAWADLVADYGFSANYKIFAFGTAL